jgi:hypothetical protein
MNTQNKTSPDISEFVLTDRQIEAGIHANWDEDWIYLITKNGTRIATLNIHSDREFIQNEADKYLQEIDWQG